MWGAASSAYQTEGYPRADGGGESVWERFCKQPGAIFQGESGDMACDGYHRYGEDLDILKSLGIKAYRFSLSWARLDPLGDGCWNKMGLDYYDRVIDACLSREITPYLTLFHWELPQALEDRGGWLNPDTPRAFARYAAMLSGHFKGRIENYFTLNEPQIVLQLGYAAGIHAPGKKYALAQLVECWRNMMLAQGMASREIRKTDAKAKVGIASTGRLCYPQSQKDAKAAARATFALLDDDWMFAHSHVLDGVCFGRVQPEGEQLSRLFEKISDKDWRIIKSDPDYLGINAYNGSQVRENEQGQPEYLPRCPGFPRTALNWPVTPQIMEQGFVNLYERYRLPLYVTECGLSCTDHVYLDGRVHDADRIDFLSRYLMALEKATDKADIRGFFHWSLTDNFEWHSGYKERFGLVYIDYPSQKRILKDSALWYSGVAGRNGLCFQE